MCIQYVESTIIPAVSHTILIALWDWIGFHLILLDPKEGKLLLSELPEDIYLLDLSEGLGNNACPAVQLSRQLLSEPLICLFSGYPRIHMPTHPIDKLSKIILFCIVIIAMY